MTQNLENRIEVITSEDTFAVKIDISGYKVEQNELSTDGTALLLAFDLKSKDIDHLWKDN